MEQNIIEQPPEAQFFILQALAAKPMNDTPGPDGTVPSGLLFGEYLQMAILNPLRRIITTEERVNMEVLFGTEMKTNVI